MSVFKISVDRAVVSKPVEMKYTQTGKPMIKLNLKTFHKNTRGGQDQQNQKKNVTEYLSGSIFPPEWMVEKLTALQVGMVLYGIEFEKEGLSPASEGYQSNYGTFRSVIIPDVPIFDQFAQQNQQQAYDPNAQYAPAPQGYAPQQYAPQSGYAPQGYDPNAQYAPQQQYQQYQQPQKNEMDG